GEADDGGRSRVEAANELAETLRERVLVRRWLDGGAHCGGVDETRSVLEAALEQVQRRAGVLAHRSRRIAPRGRRVGDAGEVEAGGAAPHRAAGAGVARVNGPGQLHDLVTALAEDGDAARAEEAVRAGYEELHRYSASRWR